MIAISFTLAGLALFAAQVHAIQFLEWRKAFDAEFDAVQWFPPYKHSDKMFETLASHRCP